MSLRDELEEFISRFPVYQYAFVSPEQIRFEESVVEVCRRDCPHYNTSWSCSPAVGKVSKSRARCLNYDGVLVFSTVTQLEEGASRRERLQTKAQHEKLTGIVADHMTGLGLRPYTLSSDCCTNCVRCGFPQEYCRHPDVPYPCIESNGIVMSDLLEHCRMDYYMSDDLCLWFSLIFYEDPFTPKEDRDG